MADPWTGSVVYESEDGASEGQISFASGYGMDENKGHVVVVHGKDGKRIGCGVLMEGDYNSDGSDCPSR